MSDPGPIKFPPPRPSDPALKLTLRRRRTAAARPTLDIIDASAAARESINALFSASRTPFTAKLPESTKLLELERTLRQLELSLGERQRVITDTEIRLAEKERDVAEMEALLQAREQLIAVSHRNTIAPAEMNPETKQALEKIRTELDRQEAHINEQKEFIREREKFLDESEEKLFEKVQAQQDKENELEQREEDLLARERRLREREAAFDPQVAAALKAEEEMASKRDEFNE
jgi:chromosome segregation ATPase